MKTKLITISTLTAAIEALDEWVEKKIKHCATRWQNEGVD